MCLTGPCKYAYMIYHIAFFSFLYLMKSDVYNVFNEHRLVYNYTDGKWSNAEKLSGEKHTLLALVIISGRSN